MAILHIRNVPHDLYERLKQRAAAEHRSLSGEVVLLLEHAVAGPDAERGTARMTFAQRGTELMRRHEAMTLSRVTSTPEEQAALLARIGARREALHGRHGTFPDSVEDIRADRDRDE